VGGRTVIALARTDGDARYCAAPDDKRTSNAAIRPSIY